jgi:hypothetical protein
MLNKAKIAAIAAKYNQTMEEKVILHLHKCKGVSTIDDTAKALGVDKGLIRLHAGKSLYIKKTIGKLILHPAGIDPGHRYIDPFDALTIHDFVYSLLCQDYNMRYNYDYTVAKSSVTSRSFTVCDAVKQWSTMTGIDCTGFYNNKNIYQTIKKEVKKYLVVFPQCTI